MSRVFKKNQLRLRREPYRPHRRRGRAKKFQIQGVARNYRFCLICRR